MITARELHNEIEMTGPAITGAKVVVVVFEVKEREIVVRVSRSGRD